MLAPGRARIQVPLEQIPSDFTNNIAFFDRYIEMQPQLQSATTLLSDGQAELDRLEKKIEGLKQLPSISKRQQKELDGLQAGYAEKYQRYQTARAIYSDYEKQWKSPFDLSHTDTVVNLLRF
jgi:Skp family chaperone for outer membrane proteins